MNSSLLLSVSSHECLVLFIMPAAFHNLRLFDNCQAYAFRTEVGVRGAGLFLSGPVAFYCMHNHFL